MEDSTLEKDKNVTPQEQQEQMNNTIKVTEESKNKTLKLAKIAGYIGLFLVLAPFFITGFGFNWFWYLVIIGVAFFTLAMFGMKGKDISEHSIVKKTLISFLVVGCLMFIWGPLNSEYGSDSSSSSSYSYSSSSSSNTAYSVSDEDAYSSSFEFHTSQDVMAYLIGKRFYSGNYYIEVNTDGIYMNGQCMSFAPTIQDFSQSRAYIMANTPTNGRFRFSVDANNGTITDKTSGDVYSLR